MKIYGREITDECSFCENILQCDLMKKGHGIGISERENVGEMIDCQMNHYKDRVIKGQNIYN